MTNFENSIIILELLLTFAIFFVQDMTTIIIAIIVTLLATIIWPAEKNSKNRIFIRFYLFVAIVILTNFFIALIILAAAYLAMCLFDFLMFTHLRKAYKKIINFYIKQGSSLTEAIKKELEKLNKNRKLKFKNETITKISSKIADLQKIMDTNNVIEVYSDFIFWHILKNKISLSVKKLSEEKIINASENIKFNKKNGYYILKTYRKNI